MIGFHKIARQVKMDTIKPEDLSSGPETTRWRRDRTLADFPLTSTRAMAYASAHV